MRVTSGCWPMMRMVVGSPTTVRMLMAFSLGLVTVRIFCFLDICSLMVPLMGTIKALGWGEGSWAGAGPDQNVTLRARIRPPSRLGAGLLDRCIHSPRQ